MKNVAVILAGCGVFDGAEINEAVLTLLHIEKNNAKYFCFAPNREQLHVIDHLKGEAVEESRNILTEAARIARGNIKALDELDASEFDALIIPGGFGAAKNLCNFAVEGTNASIQSDVETAIKAFADQKKPIGYMCIAPALVPFVHAADTEITIGTDADTASALEQLGAKHVNCPVDDIVVDMEAKVVTTPAYMLAGSIMDAEKGISKLVEKVISLA
ncbi:isoprenoid biosynthesis glyoxalase ElbB [Glaciecola sp. 1036]|uniref:isoprenoid biosynthesis glyoxalase ElbB n=1 Tax=Alteromonadaceae TaxID=72275 RepID=UPI003D04461E